MTSASEVFREKNVAGPETSDIAAADFDLSITAQKEEVLAPWSGVPIQRGFA